MKRIILFVAFCFITIESVSQWSEQQVIPTPPKLNCVSANVGGNEGWAGGDSGKVIYTTNGGTNWNYRNCLIAGSNNINVISVIPVGAYWQFVSGKSLCSFTSSNTTYICRTSNGGNNWTTVYQKPGRIRSIQMLDTLYGIAVGDPVGGRWTILKTTNGGMSFDSLYPALMQNGSELSNYNTLVYGTLPPGRIITFATNNSRIYRSTNEGLNWTSITLPFQNVLTLQIGKFHMSSQVTPFGYAAGSGAAYSTDYGVTWTAQTLPGNGNITSFHTEFGVYGNFACYSRGSLIYSSTNFTTPFTVQYTSPNGGNYTQISLSVFVFEGGNRGGWGVKDNGTLSRYYVMWAGVQKISSEIPNTFSLSQNYPNPFNPVTRIKFDIPTPLNPPFTKGGTAKPGGFVKLVVYDVLGREVAVLVNEQLLPGAYEVEWSATGGGSNYPSGVYFYQLSINNEQLATKKMVLIK